MGRHWYTAARYAAAVERLAARAPVFALGADVITGFPASGRRSRATVALVRRCRSRRSTSSRTRRARARPPRACRDQVAPRVARDARPSCAHRAPRRRSATARRAAGGGRRGRREGARARAHGGLPRRRARGRTPPARSGSKLRSPSATECSSPERGTRQSVRFRMSSESRPRSTSRPTVPDET
jgi:hypothetical protein